MLATESSEERKGSLSEVICQLIRPLGAVLPVAGAVEINGAWPLMLLSLVWLLFDNKVSLPTSKELYRPKLILLEGVNGVIVPLTLWLPEIIRIYITAMVEFTLNANSFSRLTKFSSYLLLTIPNRNAMTGSQW